jgi:serpin B
VVLAGCTHDAPGGGTGPRSAPPGAPAVASHLATVDEAPAERVTQLVHDNTAAALALFKAAAPAEGSFVFSPHSLMVALAMTYEGARGETERQMATALHLSLPKAELPGAFATLSKALDARATGGLRLHIINALFGQRGMVFNQPFVNTVAAGYRALLSRLDFAGAPAAARDQINAWVKRETDDLVPILLPPGIPDDRTVLVLTNAITFAGRWEHVFAPTSAPLPFRGLDGSVAPSPFMSLTAELPYAKGDGWQALDLPYDGGALSMLVLLPGAITNDTDQSSPPFTKQQHQDFEAALDPDRLASMISALAPREVQVYLPKFSLRSPLRAEPVLQALGMKDAFQADVADLSGIAAEPGSLFIQAVVHEAFVAVDEQGTKAAASTSVVVGRKSAKVLPVFRADRPFLFAIRDRATGAILFLGRFARP